jgi:hypothetical protein
LPNDEDLRRMPLVRIVLPLSDQLRSGTRGQQTERYDRDARRLYDPAFHDTVSFPRQVLSCAGRSWLFAGPAASILSLIRRSAITLMNDRTSWSSPPRIRVSNATVQMSLSFSCTQSYNIAIIAEPTLFHNRKMCHYLSPLQIWKAMVFLSRPCAVEPFNAR